MTQDVSDVNYLAAVTELISVSGVHIVPVNPATKHPHLEDWPGRATDNLDLLGEWWRKWPRAMIGVVTGAASGFWAIDPDGQAGLDSLKRLEAIHGALPATVRYKTPNGYRYHFAWPAGMAIKSRVSDLADHIDVRGGRADGSSTGFVIVPPSVRADGGRYQWDGREGLGSPADAPPWLLFLAAFNKRERKALAAIGIMGPEGFAGLPPAAWQGEAREWLKPVRGRLARPGAALLGPRDMAALERYVKGAIKKECESLAGASPGNRQSAIGIAALSVHSLLKGAELEGVDVTEWESAAFDQWCDARDALGDGAHTAEDPCDRWERCRADADPRDLAHVLDVGADHYFEDLSADPILLAWDQQRKARGAQPPSVAPAPLPWPAAVDGKPVKRRIENVGAFLKHRDVRVRHNSFSGLVEVSGLAHYGELSDGACNTLWLEACRLGLADDFDTFCRMLGVLADKNRFHPVLDYLDGLTWDGVPRLDRWLPIYCGADDTPLNHAIGRATLLGAVKRVREPGCKFDTLLILEGPQGAGKSSVAAILGGSWFADGLKLGWDAKQTIEATRGRWLIEVPELSGMTTREVEAIKHQLSCQADRARLAYARLPVSVPRQWIAIGTTNSDKYLRDKTGNRRFLPVQAGKIDLEALRRDRDQLWAEASRMAEFADPVVPPELWPAAAEAQEARRVTVPIEERLTELFDGAKGNIVAKEDVWQTLGVHDMAKQQAMANAANEAMSKIGWTAGRQRPPNGGTPVYVFTKVTKGEEKVWLRYWSDNEPLGIRGMFTEAEIAEYKGGARLATTAKPCLDFENIDADIRAILAGGPAPTPSNGYDFG